MSILIAAALAAAQADSAPAAPVPESPPGESSEPTSELTVHDLRNANVPMVLMPIDLAQKSAPLWVKDKPAFVVTGPAKVNEGDRVVGDVLLEAGFAHSYIGRLIVDTKISTLFSKRTLPKGTVLYGVPMSTRTVRVMTINGIPTSPIGSPEGPATNFGLVWCAPVEDDGKWTATCLPWNQGSYTMLKGQTPGFEVRSLRYSPNSPNNAGAVPVVRQPADFGKPLSYRFKLKAVSASSLTVAQETLFGTDVVFTRELRVSRSASGESVLIFGGGTIHFLKGLTDSSVVVKPVKALKPGSDAIARTAPLVAPPPIIRRPTPAQPSKPSTISRGPAAGPARS
jgi:hypothetical protein